MARNIVHIIAAYQTVCLNYPYFAVLFNPVAKTSRQSELHFSLMNFSEVVSMGSESKSPMGGSRVSLNSETLSVLSSEEDEFSSPDGTNINRYGFEGDDPGLAVPMATHREREKKWMHMLQPSKWPKYSNPSNKKYYQRMKYRARKGIPDSMRGRAWMALRLVFLFALTIFFA